eukprot:765203-Hanusia_phi.AAC.2
MGRFAQQAELQRIVVHLEIVPQAPQLCEGLAVLIDLMHVRRKCLPLLNISHGDLDHVFKEEVRVQDALEGGDTQLHIHLDTAIHQVLHCPRISRRQFDGLVPVLDPLQEHAQAWQHNVGRELILRHVTE